MIIKVGDIVSYTVVKKDPSQGTEEKIGKILEQLEFASERLGTRYTVDTHDSPILSAYNMIRKSENKNQTEPFVTRVEVIDHSEVHMNKNQGARAWQKHNCKSVELSYQDDGKTLKIFIK